MSAPQEVLKLVDRFDSNRESYMSGEYKEALHPAISQLRRYSWSLMLLNTKTMLQRQIDATDKEIDKLVYALTEEEIMIVEEK